MQAKSHLALVAPTGKKRAVALGRRPYADYRKREHLTETEIEKLIEAAKRNRFGHRDATFALSLKATRSVYGPPLPAARRRLKAVLGLPIFERHCRGIDG